jgi:hypothetical protein
MDVAGTQFEVRVGTLVSQATLAAFRLSLGRVAVPRNTLHRLRIPADHDVPTVLQRLTERDVQVVEIRRCAVPPRREDTAVQDRQDVAPPDVADPPPAGGGVVLPFRGRKIPSSGFRPAGA